MHSEGTAYILKWVGEDLPSFIPKTEIEKVKKAPVRAESEWTTLFISGGRKDKISKGDIAGLFIKQGLLESNQLGAIELKHDCAFVAVLTQKVNDLLPLVDNSKLKNKKVRVTLI